MIENLLSRLDGVRQTGPSKWVARCPAHDDKSPSLSLAETDDKVLLHCFGGCYVGDVVAAVGLELTDLFPPKESTGKPTRKRPDYRGMWLLARRSFYVLSIGVQDILAGKELSARDLQSINEAQARINDVIGVMDHE